ncbi:MAG: DUF4365 domain-containing protein [candidate division Zixibacteria bacterium]|nr:DUF4365 domain-containing protein [candidate division Zixibacteria bacterium]
MWLDDWVIKPGHSIPKMISEGIESSRTLVMCMSKAYFESEWTSLEHYSLLFRDPTNAERRFIPVLIEECEIPIIIAPFAHVDWQKKSDEEYNKLLHACPVSKEETAKAPTDEIIIDQARMVLGGHTESVLGVTITPNSKTAITASYDSNLKVWDIESGQCLTTLIGHEGSIRHVTIAPDGNTVISNSVDMTLRIWDLKTGFSRTINNVEANSWSAAISPDGKTVVSADNGNNVGVWEIKTRKLVSSLIGHTGTVRSAAISPDGKKVVSSSKDYTLKVWDLRTGKCLNTFIGHTSKPDGLAITADNRFVISGSNDRTIKKWNIKTGQCIATFEGHTGPVFELAITPDGKSVVSCSRDKTIKIWDIKTGQCKFTLKGHAGSVYGIAISPDGKTIVSGSGDNSIRIWDMPKLEAKVDVGEPVRYTNAKVILAGDTGVGKSGLAVRLTTNEFELTKSTDAHWASRYALPHESSDKGIEREIWLWDFAGQYDYRLTHQLFMDETELAVIVFNPQDQNPFEGLGQWDSDLMKAARRPFKKLLVAGRCDRGGVVVSNKSVEEFRKSRKFAKFIETSAQTGDGCEDLRKAIVKYIDWKKIPWTATRKIFKRLKEEIINLRDEGVVLLRMIELKQRLDLQITDEPFTMEELRAVVGLLAGPGLIWKLEFGDFVLLQPEKINAYASAVVRKIRKHTDEIGCILEQDILDGELDYQDTERLVPDDEAIILRAMHQTFVDHGICLQESTDQGPQLVLPSLFKRERQELVGYPAIFTSYSFTGGADEIYATLVVRLHHTSAFDNDELWKFAADFKTPDGKRVGILMNKKSEGSAEVIVYCDPKIDDNTKVIFIKYVHEHLLNKGVEVKRYRYYVCKCGHPVKDAELARELLDDKGEKAKIVCQKCGKKIQLWDLLEKKFASEEYQQKVRELEEQAKAGIANESKELILVGHAYAIAGEAGQIYRQYTNSDHGIDGEIEFKNKKGEASGRRLYLQLKSGDSYLRKRKSDGKEIFRISKTRHAKYWKDQAYPVMLVIRTSDGEIRWMNVTTCLKAHPKARQIEFDGEPFTALNLIKLRNDILKD